MHFFFYYAELQKLKETLITCSICLGIYTNPKLLSCNHVYCEKCLVGLVQQNEQGLSSLTCPTCRQVTHIPSSGPTGMQSDFRTNQLLEFLEQRGIADNLEEIPLATTNLGTATATSMPVTSEVIESIKFPCSDHHEEMKLFCETCHKTVCWKCVIKGGKHSIHEYEEVHEALSRLENKITSSLDTVGEVLARFDLYRDDIFRDREDRETEIHNFTDHDDVKTELIGQLHQNIQFQLKALEAKRDQVESIQLQLNHYLNSLGEARIQGAVLLLFNSNTVMQVNELISSLQAQLGVKASKSLKELDQQENESGNGNW